MKRQLWALACFSLLYSFSLAVTPVKKDFLQKFPLKEGHYDTILNEAHPVAFCQDEELDILLQEDASELTLTIGPKLVFAELEKSESLTESGKNCKVKTTNTFSENSLKQTISETCGKKRIYLKTHLFKLNGDTLEYSFNSEKKTETCKYKFLKKADSK